MQSNRLLRVALLSLAFTAMASAQAAPEYSLSMFGDAKYGSDFTHFSYVNPDAPKGGRVVLSALGSFDSFNPYSVKDEPPTGIGLTFATLMVQSSDEPFSQYPYLAESIERVGQNEGIIFHIHSAARFHDGSPVTAADAVATFNYLRTQGQPYYAAYYRDVDKGEAIDSNSVKYTFKHNENRELPLILGQLPVLKASELEALANKKEKTPFTGNGPYHVKEYKMGQHLVYERVQDFWGSKLPVLKGRFNFDEIRYDYYRDMDVNLEAFKSGRIDYNHENSAKRWATAYAGPKFDSKEILKAEFPHKRPAGMQAFAFNTRKTLFGDARVRQALGLAYDFEWANNNLFHGAYTRANSFFTNSDCASSGLPPVEELALLTPHKSKLPTSVFEQVFEVPATRGDGNVRDNLRQAIKLLNDAGWKIKDGQLQKEATGEAFVFTLLLNTPDFERVALPFKANLQKLGISMEVRVVDIAQYIKMVKSFEFDMIVHSVQQSVSPGNEQRDYWHSTLADQVGSQNLMGIKNPVVDELIEKLINANSRQAQLTACRALDRVLLHEHYVIPQWYIAVDRVAYWNKFGMPPPVPLYDEAGLFNWWIKP